MIYGREMTGTPSEIVLLREYVEFLRKEEWRNLSGCEWALPLLMENSDKVDWNYVAYREWALPLLMENPDKVNWEILSQCEWALPLLMENPDKVNWWTVSGCEWALPLLMANPDKVVWKWVSSSMRKQLMQPQTIAVIEPSKPKLSKKKKVDAKAEFETQLRKKLEAEFESKMQAREAEFEAKLRAAEEREAQLKEELESCKAKLAAAEAKETENPPLPATPALPMTFREQQIALMEAYNIVDPKVDFKPLIEALQRNPSKGCAILGVNKNTIGQYHALRKNNVLERKQQKMDDAVHHLERDAREKARIAKKVLETIPKLEKAKAVHAKANKFFEGANKLSDAALKM
jgi:hypothetical protein